jgi:hypothetical protein
MVSGASIEQDELVWCRACGIPHDAGTVYCSFCNQPMVPVDPNAEPAGGDDAPLATASPDDSQTGVLARAIAARSAQGRGPRQRPGGRWKLSRRPAPLTDDEIEARAAAIVALARAEEAAGLDRPQPTDSDKPSPLDEAETFAALDFLPPLRERDQLWLVAGLFCCALLILFAIGFVRFLAG